MKTSKVVFLSFIIGVGAWGITAHGKSLITIRDFPTTYADASFAQRIENETAGYDEWDSVYDEKGNCISNCAYYGITLQEELDMMADAGAQLADDLAAEEQRRRSELPTPHPQSPGSYGNFRAPIDGDICVTSLIGLRNPPNTGEGRTGSRVHQGIDIVAGFNTKLYAAYDGKIVLAAPNGTAGNEVKIEHTINGNTYYTRYLHMSSIKVTKNDQVKKGDYLGNAGNTGNSAAAHLHYGILKGNISIDPLGSCILSDTKRIAGDEYSNLGDGDKQKFDKMFQERGTRQNFLGGAYRIKSSRSSPVFLYHERRNTLAQCFPNYIGACS